MRRCLSSLLGSILLLALVAVPAAARQDATPGSGFAGLGLPTLDVTVTASGYEGIPEELEAGRYLVSVTASDDAGDEGGLLSFVQPVGVTAEEFVGATSGPPDETGADAAAGTPLADATPAEGGEGMAGTPPPFVFESRYAGGTAASPGQTARVVLDLTPGEWVAWGEDPAAPQEPAYFRATGEMPAELPEPESGATVTMGEYVIGVTEGALTAGPQTVKVENRGAQPHFIVWFKGPDDLTEEAVEAVLEADVTGTPAAVGFNPDEDLIPVAFTATQSSGTDQWITLDLEAGLYGLVCFFPDVGDGMPHAYKGMYTLLEVGG